MNNSGVFVSKIFITVALIFSFYTMTLPWVQVSPALSRTMSMVGEANTAAVDGISMIVGGITSFFSAGEASGDSWKDGISEAGEYIIKALSGEKEVVGILSKGECTPYDCSRIFAIIGNTVNNKDSKPVYLASSWLFYVIIGVGILAVILVLYGRYSCSIIYAGCVGIYMLLIYAGITKINEALGESAFTFTNSLKLACVGIASVAIPVIIRTFSDDGKKQTVTSESQSSDFLGNQGNKSKEKNEASKEVSEIETVREDVFGIAEQTASEEAEPNQIESGEPEERAKRDNDEAMRLKADRTNRQKLIERAILAACAFFVTVGVIVSLVKKQSPAYMDLSSYADLTITGFNGYGKASCNFATEAFLQDLDKLLADRNTGNGSKALDEEDVEEIAQTIFENMQITVSEENDLYNGDKVALDVVMDPEAEKILEQYNVKINFTDAHISQEVKGLPGVVSYDPFEDILVEFKGAEPYGEASASYEGDYWNLIDIEVEPSRRLRNGDEVEVSVAPLYDDDELIEEYGVQFTRSRVTMEVHGLMYYPVRIEDLHTEELARIIETAKEIARENILKEYESDEWMTGLTDQGQCFASSIKEDAQLHNQLYLVYEVDYANTSGQAMTYYYYIRLENIMVDPKTGEAVIDYSLASVPRKPDVSEDNLNLSEFVLVRLLPPRILSGITSVESFYDNYISPLEETCILSSRKTKREDAGNDSYDSDPVPTVTSDYLLPNSNTEYITEEDLVDLTWEECCLARNEIYARHGRIFANQKIAAYFESKSWYVGTIPGKEFDANAKTYLNEIEDKNAKTMLEYEKKRWGGSYY